MPGSNFGYARFVATATFLTFFVFSANIQAATRIAFVPDEGTNAIPEPIPSLLINSFAAAKDIGVVERARVRDCLAELKLTAAGLASGEGAAQLGKMLAADLIVTGDVIDSGSGDNSTRICIFRVIDSRTGIVLRDSLSPLDELKTDVSPVVREIVDAAATARLPDEKRRYVSIVAVSSEEPGTQLDPVAQSLIAFLEHDLARTPGVILLERQRLEKLTQEHDLTGLDQRLKTSTVLIDAGVRRAADPLQITVTLQLHGLGGADMHSASFTAPMEDMIAVSHGVVATVLKAIDAAPQLPIVTDRAVEAADFARRAAHLLIDKQKREAASCAEAALALNPSDQNLVLAHDAWKSMTYDQTWPPVKDPPLMDELRAGIRAEQISELQCQRIIRNGGPEWEMQNIELFSWALRACQANTVPASPDTPEHKLWKQLKQASLENYSAALKFTIEHKGLAIRYYAEKISQTPVLAESQAEREQIIAETIAGVDAETDAGRADDGHLAFFYAKLQHCEERYRSEKPEDDRAFWRKFTTHREPYVRMMAYRTIMAFGGDEGRAAGVKFFDTILKEAPADPLHSRRDLQNETADFMAMYAMRPFAAQADSYFENFLATAEKNNDSNCLVRWPFVVAKFPAIHVQSAVSEDWRKRIIALIDRVPPDPKLSGNAQYLRELLGQQQSGNASRTRPQNAGTGSWSRYQQRPIALNNLDPALDHLCGFDLAGDNLIGVWCNWQHGPLDKTPIRCRVAQVPIAGGDIKSIATITDLEPAFFTCINCSPDGVCIAQKDKGVFVVTNGSVQLLEAKDGLTAGDVKSAAWLNGLLYLGFDGGVTQYDPRKHSFKILASAKAVTARGPLDGGVNYTVAGIISDGARGCLWLTIVDNNNPHVEGPRPGLWKYDPARDSFTEPHPGDSLGVLQWAGEKILCGGFRPALFDPETGTVRPLTGYNKWTTWLNGDRKDCAFFQTDFLFASSGYICAPDNIVAEKPRMNPGFDLVASCSNGFIAGDSRTGKLFAVQQISGFKPQIAVPITSSESGISPAPTHADIGSQPAPSQAQTVATGDSTTGVRFETVTLHVENPDYMRCEGIPSPATLQGFSVMRAGASIDLVTFDRNVYLMRQKGKVRKIWGAPEVNYQPVFQIFDGRYAWLCFNRYLLPPALLAFDPQSGRAIDFSEVTGMPLENNTTLAAAPIGPGRICLAGDAGRSWIGIASVEGTPISPVTAFKLFHECHVNPSRNDEDEWKSTDLKFSPIYMLSVNDPTSPAGNPHVRILLGRDPRDLKAWYHPLLIDPQKQSVEVLSAEINAVEPGAFTVYHGGVFWAWPGMTPSPDNPKGGGILWRVGFPDFARTRVADSVNPHDMRAERFALSFGDHNFLAASTDGLWTADSVNGPYHRLDCSFPAIPIARQPAFSSSNFYGLFLCVPDGIYNVVRGQPQAPSPHQN
jgi:curli biogenesis system outer membrane secretion channel CsgG